MAAQILNDRTFIPLRFVSESLGDEVQWDGDTRTINIISEQEEMTLEEQLQNNHIVDYLGAEISEIKEKYGEPEATDYYRGGIG